MLKQIIIIENIEPPLSTFGLKYVGLDEQLSSEFGSFGFPTKILQHSVVPAQTALLALTDLRII